MSTARAVIDLKLAQIRICTSLTSRFQLVHDDRRALYVRLRSNREVACCPSAGFGDVLGDWSGLVATNGVKTERERVLKK